MVIPTWEPALCQHRQGFLWGHKERHENGDMRGRQKAVRRGEPKPVVSIWMGFLICRVYWEAEDTGVKQQLLGTWQGHIAEWPSI